MKILILILLTTIDGCVCKNATDEFGIIDCYLCSNNTTSELEAGEYDDTMLYEQALRFENIIGTVVPTIFGLIVIIGLGGNLLVMVVVLTNRQMHTSTNTLIISLAMSDLLFLLLCVPFTAADYALPVWVFSRAGCGILQYLQFVSAYASVWTLVLMSFDRFLAVVWPVRSLTLRSVKNTLVAVVVLWAVMLMTNMPMLLIHDVYSYNFVHEERSTCTFLAQITLNATNTEVRAYYFSFNILGYALPLGVVCILYAFMLRRLWFGMRSFASSKTQVEKRKVTFMVTGVIVTFAACWLPLNVCFFLVGSSYEQGHHSSGIIATMEFVIFQVFAQILAYSNSCLNPILYAFLSETFRKGFLSLFDLSRCRKGAKKRLYRTEFKLRTGAASSFDIERVELPVAESSLNNNDDENGNSVMLTNLAAYSSLQRWSMTIVATSTLLMPRERCYTAPLARRKSGARQKQGNANCEYRVPENSVTQDV